MKKILYFVAFIFLLTINWYNVKAKEVTLVRQRIGDLYTYYYDDNYERYRFLFLNKYLFGENYAYCLELGKNINNNFYTYSTSFDDINIEKDDMEYIKLVSYYGYDYPGHETDRYYMAAQELIWSKLSNINVKWVENMDPQKLVEVTPEKEEIESLVANHNKLPSFDQETIDIIKGETVVLQDNNNVISNYKSNSNYVRIEGNNLIIDANIDTNKIILTKNSNTDKVFLLYTNGTSQKMMSSGSVEEIKSIVNLNIIGGSIKINKIDSETGDFPQGEGSLKGAKYNLYNANNELVDTFITGEKEYIDNLSIGEYYLKEIEPSKGYRLDEKTYSINLTKEDLDKELILYEEIIKRDIDIFKVYATNETGILYPEENITFEIYDNKSNLVDKITTDTDGYAHLNLPFGTYTIKQINSTEGYEKISDQIITIDKYDERPVYKLFTNAEIKSKIKIIKKDFDTKENILNSNVKFKIYDVKNNKFISFKIFYPEEKEIDTFEISDDGTFITPEELPYGVYRLYEVDEKMEGYLFNDEGIEIVIGDSTTYINDKTYGRLTEVEFYNKRVKGKIELYKYGEDIIYKDNSYRYKETLLPGVVFKLYAKEDITENEKILYHKDDEIQELETDDNGYCMIDDLPLGKYYLKEVKSNKDNQISSVIYDVNLLYKDQYTEKILENIDIYNYIQKGKLVITKYDKETNNPIPNTLIEIRKDNNTVIYKGYTNQNGQIIIDDLKYGDYYLSETEASTGYQLNDENINFTIDKEQLDISLYNERIKVPNTMSKSYILIPIITIIVLINIILLKLTHKNKIIYPILVIIIVLLAIYISLNFFKGVKDKEKNNKAVEAYLSGEINKKYDPKYQYNALIDIPTIKLKRGILDIDNEYNKAKYNIELVKENSNIIVLASHNGNNYNSYFKDLNKLELGDSIYYYQNGKIDEYIYSDNYEIKKDGYADLYYKIGNKSIVLITCKDDVDDAQIVYIGYFKETIPVNKGQ